MKKEDNCNIFQDKQVQEKYKKIRQKFIDAKADENRLTIFDDLIFNAALLACDLDRIKNVPSILFNPKYPTIQKQSEAGKMRIKLIAQYRETMTKLYKTLLGVGYEEDDELEEYE